MNRTKISKIALIDYGAGNIQSVYNALQKIKSDHDLSFDVIITHNPTDIESADKIILPGVGSYNACMKGILSHDGLKQALDKAVLQDKKPFLGICVGMQLLSDYGLEHGHHQGLGYISGHVAPFELPKDFKIPHVGWNIIHITCEHPLLEGVRDMDYVYFVHSYYMQLDKKYIALMGNYGHDFPAMIIKDNIVGIQFHPEKSQSVGLNLLRNFILWTI